MPLWSACLTVTMAVGGASFNYKIMVFRLETTKTPLAPIAKLSRVRQLRACSFHNTGMQLSPLFANFETVMSNGTENEMMF